ASRLEPAGAEAARRAAGPQASDALFPRGRQAHPHPRPRWQGPLGHDPAHTGRFFPGAPRVERARATAEPRHRAPESQAARARIHGYVHRARLPPWLDQDASMPGGGQVVVPSAGRMAADGPCAREQRPRATAPGPARAAEEGEDKRREIVAARRRANRRRFLGADGAFAGECRSGLCGTDCAGCARAARAPASRRAAPPPAPPWRPGGGRASRGRAPPVM
ncbi:unnamed protein product, partial [Prorocentrum cordatum]